MDAFAQYTEYDGLGLAELVARKDVHPRELLEAAIARIERTDPTLNAVVHEMYDSARAAADSPLPQGPFTGVPYLLKDMVAHSGTPLTLGCEFLRRFGYVADRSHPVVERSERAGLIIVGKTNACEFGLLPVTEPLAFGPTANPWNTAHSPGGSSGGAGAAVAARMVPLAHGNDGGGSIRIPASCCGLFGLKPSRGRNPEMAEVNVDGLVVEHCLSRSVRDSAALLDVTHGARAGDRWWAPSPSGAYLDDAAHDPEPLTIGFTTDDFLGRPAHADCAAAVREVAELCEALGHRVEPACPAVDGERFNEAFSALWASMAASVFTQIMHEARRYQSVGLLARVLGDRLTVDAITRVLARSWRSPFEPRTRHFAAIGESISHAEVIVAVTELRRASYEMARWFEKFDCLLTPTLAEPPVVTGRFADLSDDDLSEQLFAYDAYAPICNSAGLPAMTVPLCWNAAGLPIGVHFAAAFGAESTLFRLAGQLERARPWASRRPPGF